MEFVRSNETRAIGRDACVKKASKVQGMPCIVVDGYNKINWNVYFCVALVRRSFHPSSLLGKFIERGRRHRAIGDGRRLLFNGATTCRQIKIKKWREGGNEEWKKYVSIVQR